MWGAWYKSEKSYHACFEGNPETNWLYGSMLLCTAYVCIRPPPNSSVETLIPNVQVLVGGASGRSLGQGHEGEAPVMGLMPL